MLEYSMLSKVGSRKQNEDYICVARCENKICFILADGLGGHGGGAEASRMTADYISEDFRAHGEVSKEYMSLCFEKSQSLLRQQQKSQRREQDMKTTLVLLMADKNHILWGHIGDSRLYQFQRKKYIFHTMDHSVPQMLVKAGEITEKEIRGHADRNRLLRVMGIEWEYPQYEIAAIQKPEKQMSFLLCSDGFWELIEEKEMVKALKKAKSPKEWLDIMEQKILKNGKGKEMDNYSAIAVFLGEEEKIL